MAASSAATVLDSLVIELGLDATQFQRAADTAREEVHKFEEESFKAAQAIESHGNRIGEFFTTLKRGALGFAAAFFGGRELEQLINHLTSLDAVTGRTARNIGMNVQELSAWQNAAKAAGGTAEGVTGTLASLNDQLQLFTMGQPSQLTTLLRNFPGGGINPFNNLGQIRNAADIMLEISERMEKMGVAPERAAPFLKMMGMDEGSINLILLGTTRLRALLDEQRRLGTTTQESARQAQEYQHQLQNLDTAATNLGRTLFVAIAPSLTRITAAFTSGVQAIAPMVRMWQAFEALLEKSTIGTILNHLLNPIQRIRDLLAIVGKEFEIIGVIFDKLGITSAIESGKRSLAQEELKLSFGSRGITGGPGAAQGPPLALPGGTRDMGENWRNFLSGLSYLETTQGRGGLTTAASSATGFFQFTSATAQDAMRAGIPDPRVGSYEEQSAATMAFIRKFHPEAAAALDRGDNAAAVRELRQRWPSLPGSGQQQQSAERYRTFTEELKGGGPRPPGEQSPFTPAPIVPYAAMGQQQSWNNSRGDTTNSHSTEVHIGSVNVQTQADDARGIARDIKPELERWAFASQANYGLDG